MAERLRIGVVGTGAMGRHHVRILSELPRAHFVGLFDSNEEIAQGVAKKYGTQAFASLDHLVAEVDAVVLSVPTVLHAEIGCRLLEQGLHLLVEKPIAASVDEADRLVERSADRVLAAGHVEFFNPAVEALLAQESPPRFVVIERLSSFTRRSVDIDVVLDLMIHDIQILQALDPTPVVDVKAVGVTVLSKRIDIANVRIEFESGCVANVTASRVSAERVRHLRAFLKDRYYSLDYEKQTLTGLRLEELDGGRIEVSEDRISRLDITVEREEPLRREIESFVAACEGQDVDYVDGAAARRALVCGHRILDAIGKDVG